MKLHINGDPCPKTSPYQMQTHLRPLRGIVTPLVTPLQDRNHLDEEGFERLLNHVIDGGVDGLFLLGTTGESVALSRSVKRAVVQRAVRVARGRLPILVGVADNSIAETLSLAQDAADLGANAVVATPPFYFPFEQAELSRYVQLLGRESPLPVMLYNMPRLTKHWFTVETVSAASQLENVIGLKDSSGDMNYFKDVLSVSAGRPDWSLMVGPEQLMVESVRLGGHGCVGGGSNVWPQLFADIYRATVARDDRCVVALQSLLVQMSAIYRHGDHASGVVRGIKCALELLGICSGRTAEPLNECDASQRAEIELQLVKLGLFEHGRGVSKHAPRESPVSQQECKR